VEALLIVLAIPKLALATFEERTEQWVSNRFGERLYEIFSKPTPKSLGYAMHRDIG
jgi:hypothetical protein